MGGNNETRHEHYDKLSSTNWPVLALLQPAQQYLPNHYRNQHRSQRLQSPPLQQELSRSHHNCRPQAPSPLDHPWEYTLTSEVHDVQEEGELRDLATLEHPQQLEHFLCRHTSGLEVLGGTGASHRQRMPWNHHDAQRTCRGSHMCGILV